jgi:hypothetical protein
MVEMTCAAASSNNWEKYVSPRLHQAEIEMSRSISFSVSFTDQVRFQQRIYEVMNEYSGYECERRCNVILLYEWIYLPGVLQ